MAKTKQTPDNTKPSKWNKRRWVLRQARRLVVLLGVGLLLFVIGYGFYAWEINRRGDLANRKIETQLKRYRLLDRYPSYLAEQSDPQEGTSAGYWRAAMDAVPTAGDRPLLSVGTVHAEDIEPRQQYHPDMVSAMREVFEQNPLFLDLIHAAERAPAGRFGLGRSLADPQAGHEVLGGSRAVARWLNERARLAEVDNDGEAFTQTMESIFAISEQVGRDPVVISALVGVSIDALARYAIIDGLSRIELTPQQLDRLIKAMRERRESLDLLALLGFELSWRYHAVASDVQSYIRFTEARQAMAGNQLLLQHPDWFDEEAEDEQRAWYEPFWQDLLLSTCPGRYEIRNADYMATYLEDYEQLEKLKDKPKKRWAWLQKRNKEIEAINDRDEIDWNDTRSMHDGWASAIARTMIRTDSVLTVGIVALQVERYRVVHGRWPAKLVDATGEPPIDAYGETIRYRQTPEGVVVYTVGNNTIDEQGYGQHSDDPPSQFMDADDWAHTLYNPELRNALPPPKDAIMPESAYDDETFKDGF